MYALSIIWLYIAYHIKMYDILHIVCVIVMRIRSTACSTTQSTTQTSMSSTSTPSLKPQATLSAASLVTPYSAPSPVSQATSATSFGVL